jgi:hypothetical protein
MNNWLERVALAVLAAACLASPATPREWKETPKALAQEYAFIHDDRGNGRMVMVMWLVPEMFDEGQAREMLRKNLVLGVIDAKVDALGTFSYSSADSITLSDASGAPVHMLTSSEIPPTVAGLLTIMEAVIGKSMGAMGQNFHWYVFDGSKINACSANAGFAVNLAEEHYTYATPIPGCSAK